MRPSRWTRPARLPHNRPLLPLPGELPPPIKRIKNMKCLEAIATLLCFAAIGVMLALGV